MAPRRCQRAAVLASRREVAGLVECHGNVELHADGFRAQRGRPRALVVTPMRNAALVGRLGRAYEADVVTVDGPRELAAWCHQRNLGLDASVVDGLLGPGAVAGWREAGRRRTQRLVAGVAASVVAAVLLALLASFALADRERPTIMPGRPGDVTIRPEDSRGGSQPARPLANPQVRARGREPSTSSSARGDPVVDEQASSE